MIDQIQGIIIIITTILIKVSIDNIHRNSGTQDIRSNSRNFGLPVPDSFYFSGLVFLGLVSTHLPPSRYGLLLFIIINTIIIILQFVKNY